MFTPVDLDLEAFEAYGLNRTTECINGWDYEVQQGDSSLVTEFDLVCGKSGLIEASQSIFMVSVLIGCLVFGAISDRFSEVYHYSVPMVVYGIIPMAAGGFCLLLPETLNVEFQEVTVMGHRINGPLEDQRCTEDTVKSS